MAKSLPGLAEARGHIVYNPMEQYKVVRWTDDTANPMYIGHLDVNGAWLIEKIDSVAMSKTYCRGESAFVANWNDRANLTYVEFDEVF